VTAPSRHPQNPLKQPHQPRPNHARPPAYQPTTTTPAQPTTTPAQPTGKPKARTAAVTCTRSKTSRAQLTVTCRLTNIITPGRHQFEIRLGRHAHTTLTSHQRTLTIKLALPHGLRHGTYQLTITTKHPTTTTTQPLKLPNIRSQVDRRVARSKVALIAASA